MASHTQQAMAGSGGENKRSEGRSLLSHSLMHNRSPAASILPLADDCPYTQYYWSVIRNIMMMNKIFIIFFLLWQK